MLKLTLALILALFAWAAAASQPAKALKIVLDPGHSDAAPGALGIRGIHEISYNNTFATELARALEAADFQVLMTRQPEEEISLDQRAEIANTSGADLFLSVHHDSAQLRYLEAITVNNKPAWRTKIPLQGYSIFVSALNPRFEKSLEVATAMGSGLHVLGRPPALHHTENIPGEGRELLDTRLGIYRFDELLVLRKTKIPAVLLEVGVIVDGQDEAYVTSAKSRAAMVNAIVNAMAGSLKR
jgi:N-acetylmuramoyl-L-alanine amidase